jgi:hypothetical protein
MTDLHQPLDPGERERSRDPPAEAGASRSEGAEYDHSG